MNTKSLLRALLALLALSSCGNRLTKGEVVEKHYEPERTYMMLMPIVMSTGKTTTMTMIPYYMHDDADYVFTVHGRDENGDEVEESWYVTPEVFNRIEPCQFVIQDAVGATTEDTDERGDRANE